MPPTPIGADRSGPLHTFPTPLSPASISTRPIEISLGLPKVPSLVEICRAASRLGSCLRRLKPGSICHLEKNLLRRTNSWTRSSPISSHVIHLSPLHHQDFFSLSRLSFTQGRVGSRANLSTATRFLVHVCPISPPISPPPATLPPSQPLVRHPDCVYWLAAFSPAWWPARISAHSPTKLRSFTSSAVHILAYPPVPRSVQAFPSNASGSSNTETHQAYQPAKRRNKQSPDVSIGSTRCSSTL